MSRTKNAARRGGKPKRSVEINRASSKGAKCAKKREKAPLKTQLQDMAELLAEEGLLLRLPESTLNEAMRRKGGHDLIVSQINMQIMNLGSKHPFNTVLSSIRRLADIAGFETVAMMLLVELAARHMADLAESTADDNNDSGRALGDMGALVLADHELLRLASRERRAALSRNSATSWDPEPILSALLSKATDGATEWRALQSTFKESVPFEFLGRSKVFMSECRVHDVD